MQLSCCLGHCFVASQLQLFSHLPRALSFLCSFLPALSPSRAFSVFSICFSPLLASSLLQLECTQYPFSSFPEFRRAAEKFRTKQLSCAEVLYLQPLLREKLARTT